MPNPGGPYLGCETCRRRRIKCDRGKPECARCRKYGSVCPGYPLEQDARFRDQTSKVIQKEHRADVLTSVYLDENIGDICPNATEWQGIAIAAKTNPTISSNMEDLSPFTKPPNISVYVILTEFFFIQSVMPVGWYSFLPRLHQRASTDDCLKTTLFATSCFLAANQLQDTRMVRKARQEYGAALQAVNAAIGDPLRCLQDETLVSILLLNVLDDLAGHSSFVSCSHLEGCTQLIKLREAKDFQTECSSDLVHSIILQTQPVILEGCRAEASFFREDVINEWLWRQTRPSPAVEVSSFCLKISRLSKMTQDALSGDKTDIKDCAPLLIALLEDGMNLETSMAKWYKCQDGRWARKTSTSAINGSVSLDCYSDIQVAKTWNHWRVARILLHSLLLSSMAHIQVSAYEFKENLDVLQSNSLAIIRRMLLGISASIPYHLQQIDEMGRSTTQISQRALGGRALMWPLKMVLKCQWSTPADKHEAVEALHFIGDVVGVKQAVIYLQEAVQLCEL